MTNAPFYIGQKVICVSSNSMVVKGKTYTISSCLFCNNCKTWFATVAEHAPLGGTFGCICGHIISNRPVNRGALASRFAPIEPIKAEIPESLKEQAEEMIGVKETIKLPEKELA